MRSMRFKKKKEVEAEQEEHLRIITFTVGEELFGADILRIKQVDIFEKCNKMPDLPNFIEGFIFIRKELVPLIDLRKRLYNREGNVDLQTRIIVAMVANNMVGFVVDSVVQVMTVPKQAITQPPKIMTRVDEDYLQGVVAVNNQRILLIDFDKILSKNKRRELLNLLSEEEKTELLKLVLDEKKKNVVEKN